MAEMREDIIAFSWAKQEDGRNQWFYRSVESQQLFFEIANCMWLLSELI